MESGNQAQRSPRLARKWISIETKGFGPYAMAFGTGVVRESVRTVGLASTLRHREITINKEPQQREGRYWSPKESLKRMEGFSESERPCPTLTNKHNQCESKRE